MLTRCVAAIRRGYRWYCQLYYGQRTPEMGAGLGVFVWILGSAVLMGLSWQVSVPLGIAACFIVPVLLGSLMVGLALLQHSLSEFFFAGTQGYERRRELEFGRDRRESEWKEEEST